MKKIIFYAFLLFVAYKGLDTYYGYKHLKLFQSCNNSQEMERLQANGTDEEKVLYVKNIWKCIEKKQSFMDKLFLKMPRN